MPEFLLFSSLLVRMTGAALERTCRLVPTLARTNRVPVGIWKHALHKLSARYMKNSDGIIDKSPYTPVPVARGTKPEPDKIRRLDPSPSAPTPVLRPPSPDV